MLDLALRRPSGILEGAILNGIHTKRRLSLFIKRSRLVQVLKGRLNVGSWSGLQADITDACTVLT